jgi:hypothetical protein
MSSVVNFGLYQVGWFAIVLGAANLHPWHGTALAVALIAVHLALASGFLRQLALILLCGVIGLVLDSLQLRLGVFRFASGATVLWLAPPWDIALWMQFATILPFCLSWLSRRYALATVLGFAGGPLAFYSGERLGGVTFLEPRLLNFLVLGVVWAIAFPSLVWLSDTLVVAHGLGRRYRFMSRDAAKPADSDEQ